MTEDNMKKMLWAIIIVVIIAVGIAAYMIFSNMSSDGASNKLDIISQPNMSVRADGNRFSPTVSVTVKNKTGKAITVRMKCTVYAKDGSVTTGLTSAYVTLVAGETATLTAKTAYTYSALSYYDICSSFGDVQYEFY